MNAKSYIASAVVFAAACLCPACQGQQPQDNRTQKPEDLIAYVKGEDGRPVSGVEAKVVIERTIGFFPGSGIPTINSLATSDADGKLRFSNDSNWRDWIKAEVAAKNKSKSLDESRDVTEFKAFHWCLSGYWPRTNSRIELESYGSPGLWHGDGPVILKLPELHATRIQVSSVADRVPLANVRLFITQHLGKKNTGLWDRVTAFAWTDACGSALVWLPTGAYDVRWNTTTAAVGAKEKSDLLKIEKTEFGLLNRPTPPRNAIGDLDRDTAFQRKSFYWNDTQPPLRVENSPPPIYELAIEPPTVIVP